MKEGEIPKVGSYINLLGTAYITIEGNCLKCSARGNLDLCTKLPTCADPVSHKSIVAYEQVQSK